MKGKLLIGAAFLLAAVPAFAHHSIVAEFDPNQAITFKGAVKKIEWTNPHIYTSIETTSADGKTIVYRVEGGPPNALYRQGWRKDTLKVGDLVTVSGIRAKSASSMNVGHRSSSASDAGLKAQPSALFDPSSTKHHIAVVEDGCLAGRNRNLRRVEDDVGAPISRTTHNRRRRRMTMADLDRRAHGAAGHALNPVHA